MSPADRQKLLADLKLLVDTDLRFQACPLQSNGWVIVGAPKIWGGDGQE